MLLISTVTEGKRNLENGASKSFSILIAFHVLLRSAQPDFGGRTASYSAGMREVNQISAAPSSRWRDAALHRSGVMRRRRLLNHECGILFPCLASAAECDQAKKEAEKQFSPVLVSSAAQHVRRRDMPPRVRPKRRRSSGTFRSPGLLHLHGPGGQVLPLPGQRQDPVPSPRPLASGRGTRRTSNSNCCTGDRLACPHPPPSLTLLSRLGYPAARPRPG